jgi:MSHA biogenesis protein MshL
LKLDNFDAFIEALQTQGDVHVLSSPRVSTINNQKAVIKVGSDEFFVTGISTETTDSNNGTNQSVNVELTPFFSGVALDVTPQIDEDGRVTLHIHPSVSDVKEKVKEISVSTNDGKLSVPLALSSIRESDSIVKASSGQVVVIGGLMQNVVSDNSAGVPFLADLPLIGGLFRHDKEVRLKSELVILLRPIVISNDSQWGDVVTQDMARSTNKFPSKPQSH